MMFSNGDKIGPYTVRETAGQGGMATVYKAWHDGLHRFEALKVPRGVGGGAPDSAYIQRLLAEARVAAGLHHPHIVAIHGVSEPFAPIPFFAMDWVDGRDLAKVLGQRGPFSLAETTQILSGVAAALDYAHECGVVHRDIKPANILLSEKNGVFVPKVVDFGISRAAEDDDGEGATKLTKSGMIVGTPEYMSPEQAGSGEIVDHRTDVYSLAVVAYEMLCGCPPFTAGAGVSRLSILISHVRDDAPLFDQCPDFPRDAGAAILRALSKSPTNRPSSCVAFIEELTAATPQNWPRFSPQNAGAERTPFDSSGFVPSDVATICERPTPVAGLAETPTGATYSLRARLEAAAKTPLPQTPPAPQTRIDVVALPTKTQTQVEITAPTTPVLAPIVVARPRNNSRIAVLAAIGGILVGGALVFALSSRNVGEKAEAKAEIKSPVAVSTLPKTTEKPVLATPIRPRTTRETRSREIDFQTIERHSDSRLVGTSYIAQRGQKGVREVTFALTLQGDREISRRTLMQRVVRSPISQIVVVGTRRAAPKIIVRPVEAPAPRPRVREIVAPRAPLVRARPWRDSRPQFAAKPSRIARSASKFAARRAARSVRRIVREAPLPP